MRKSGAFKIRIDHKGTCGHIYLLVKEEVSIVYESLLLLRDGCGVVIKVYPYLLVLERMLTLRHGGIVT
jgi:hypothetical protein